MRLPTAPRARLLARSALFRPLSGARLPADAGNTTYQSPILHHVLLRDLEPDTEHFYSVGALPGPGDWLAMAGDWFSFRCAGWRAADGTC